MQQVQVWPTELQNVISSRHQTLGTSQTFIPKPPLPILAFPLNKDESQEEETLRFRK